MTISSDFVAKKCGFAAIVEYVDTPFLSFMGKGQKLLASLRRVTGNKQVLPLGTY